MIETEVTTIVVNRKSWRVESIGITYSSVILLIILLIYPTQIAPNQPDKYAVNKIIICIASMNPDSQWFFLN